MKAAEKLIAQLKAIDKVDECYETCAKNQFYIIDEDETVILQDACIDINLCFSVINSLLATIYFIPVDGNGIIGKTMECCEAVIFNDISFSFIELKLNATSEKPRALKTNRTKAVSQLENTIKFFDEKLDGNYQGLLLEAIVATPNFYPRANTSWQKFETKFLERNGIPLIETKEKIYD